MRNLTKYLAAALIIGSTIGAAEARVAVGFDFGNVALGYSDGYYDNGHHWHNWRRHDDMARWQREHASAWHNWRHDDRRHH